MDKSLEISLNENQIVLLAKLIADRVTVDDPADSPSEWLTKLEAAQLLGISISSLEKRTREEIIPGHKFGSCRRYKRAELLALVPSASASRGVK